MANGRRRLIWELAETLLGLAACEVTPRGRADWTVVAADAEGPTSSGGESETSASDAESSTSNPVVESDTESVDSDRGDAPVGFDLGGLPDLGPPPTLQSQCAQVDLLFVIDNSHSMADEQTNLVASFPGFIDGISTFLGADADYRVGIITTDAYAFNTFGCTDLGDLVTQTGGELSSHASCGPFAEGHPFMTNADDLATSFACAADVGIAGAGVEKPMQALTTLLASRNDPCTANFVREDAVLVITIITDEEDDGDSIGDPWDWHAAVLDAKGGDPSRVMVLSLIGRAQPNACSSQWDGAVGAEFAPRLADFTERFPHGTVGDACASDYGPYFAALLADVEQECIGGGPQG
jgi:hypothetical protein